ncbi:DUF6978 family protein [Bombilactobacillus bombi]|uniref:DUF6978 family protein n=1 Tax=Bombilactobacillus bombi TaxID=1303590 RepID=UPI001F087398|nr:hypothetical protein [Bombilactobacillus bombi]
MNLSNLTLDDAYKLIAYEKNPHYLLEYNEVYNQIVNTITYDNETYKCQIDDHRNSVFYALNVHTTPVETIFSIGLRDIESNIHLIRFDFGNHLRHTNNQGKKNEKIIHGSHVHFMSVPDKYSVKNVIAVGSIEEFKNLKRIKETFLKFIDYTNIR